MRYIIVEGNIGAGKTSLAQKLASDLGGIAVLEEFAENTFLPQFYDEPDKFAFPLELSFLAARYKQLTGLFAYEKDALVVADYHFEKSLLFASVNLVKGEFGLYKSFFEILAKHIPGPDLVVYLKKDVGVLRENIAKRGRSFESNISDDYLGNINAAYAQLLEKLPADKLLEIDSNTLDFVKNPDDYNLIINSIKGKL